MAKLKRLVDGIPAIDGTVINECIGISVEECYARGSNPPPVTDVPAIEVGVELQMAFSSWQRFRYNMILIYDENYSLRICNFNEPEELVFSIMDKQ